MNPAGSSQQRSSHPFTEPTVIPLTKYFWKNGYNTMIGSTPITASAIRMEELGIQDLAQRDVMTLSTGQARRVLIARALVHDPSVLVFDEPCTGLDPEGMYHVRRTMSCIAGDGRAVVLVTHYPEDIVPQIGRALLLKEGRVLADGAKADVLTSANLSELFGVPLTIHEHAGIYHLFT